MLECTVSGIVMRRVETVFQSEDVVQKHGKIYTPLSNMRKRPLSIPVPQEVDL